MPADNTLIVDQGDSELLYSLGLVATEPRWIGTTPRHLETGLSLTAKVRYRQADQRCRILGREDGSIEVRFDQPQRAVTPGQFIVFYDGDCCLGGATIDSLVPAAGSTKIAATAAV